MSARCLIVNADDFGQSRGINRGIVQCHVEGIVTSTSLMVTGRAVEEAVDLSRQFPDVSIGLHFDVWGEDEREFDTHDLGATRDEFRRQLDEFVRLMGRLPTHIDSHRHAHREEHLFPHFLDWTRNLNVPVRGDGTVSFVGGFYAQWEWRVTNLEYVSVSFLQGMLREEVPPGWTEFSCHPGYITDDYRGVYLKEREAEIATLTDPRVQRTIINEGIRLLSYADVQTSTATGAT
jgi:chitin disaccharide deacetylase